MTLRYEAISDIGLRRRLNQDMAMVGGQLVRDEAAGGEVEMGEDFCFGAIVCDGLGGHSHGEIASEMVCVSFREFVEGLGPGLDDSDVVMALKQWFREVNGQVMVRGGGKLMCTTLTGLLFYGEMVFVLNSGDSRTYRRRHGILTRLTVDHSERERTGDPTVPASRMYNCVGLPDSFIDVNIGVAVEGDSYLICSDGLSGEISEEDLVRDFQSARLLLDDALRAGAPDNVTVVSVEVVR